MAYSLIALWWRSVHPC